MVGSKNLIARELNRKRAKKPKVKTGCVTCKIRRVKCDETRPECLRCQKFGRGYCDGYEAARPDQLEKRPILPKRSGTIIIQKPMPKREPALQVFQNQDEFSCFRLYCEEVAPKLSSWNRSIWHQLLLQAGQNQPFIRHAIITIGALNRAVMAGDRSSSPSPSPIDGKKIAGPLHLVKPDKTSLHSFALEHYGQFLQGMKGELSGLSKEQGQRMAMIACLLVVCIENLQYNYDSALRHAQEGFKMVEELKSDSPAKLDTGMSSPAPNIVEDELVQQFQRLELQVMAMYDARIPAAHVELKHQGTFSVRYMPTIFMTLEEARLYLDLIMRRTFHFMGSALTEVTSKPYLRFGEERGETDYPPADIGSWLRDAPDELSVEQERYAAENRRWAQAYEHIFRAALKNLERPESLKALLVKIHSLAMSVRFAGHLSKSELVYDEYIMEFQQIVRLSEMVLNHKHSDRYFSEGTYSFDMALIWPLMTPAMSCRDRQIRRRAISLLRLRPWREAQWGSETSADVAVFLMEVEEEGVKTEYIPEWARARLSGIDANLEERVLRLHCIRGIGATAVHRSCEKYYWGGAAGD